MLSKCITLKVLDLVPFGQTDDEGQFFALRLSQPGWQEWHPGQFVMLRPLSFGLEHVWGRPFSICRMTDSFLTCFFKVQGPGTKKMAKLRIGDSITAWGPLGTWFSVETDCPTLLIAGGIGLAPFVGYVGQHPLPHNISLLFGHRDPIGCFPIDSLSEHISIETFRDRNSADLDKFVGMIRAKMEKTASQQGLVLACGPEPLLKIIHKLALELNVHTQLSLENRMACGVGACLGCVCQSSEHWPSPVHKNWPIRVCTNGPVFWASNIRL